MTVAQRVRDTLRGGGRVLKNLRIVDQRKLYLLWERSCLHGVISHCGVDCVFDVGANYGQYARMLRDKVGYKGLIVSFEPVPEAAASLRKQAAGDPNWQVEEMAVAKADGALDFNVMSDSQFSSLSTPRHDEIDLFRYKNSVKRVVTVKTENLATTFARLQAQHGFQAPFLKMDTQGFDVEIVSHAKDTVRRFVGLQSEMAIKKIYTDSVDFRQAISLYEECGFEMCAFVPNNFGYFPRMVESDCIMIRKDLMVKPAA